MDLFRIFLWTLFLPCTVFAQRYSHAMVVTGGHDFDRRAFFQMLDEIPGLEFSEVIQPEANRRIGEGDLDSFDLLIFYDMWDSIYQAEKEGYLRLFTNKKPMIFLHHSLVSYQDWIEFKNMIGGRYYTRNRVPESHYKHDEWIQVNVLDHNHAVMHGISDFQIFDETYGNCEILPQVHPLFGTSHSLSMPILGWINEYNGHEIIYLQSGHGPEAFRNKDFQKILKQSIEWSLRKN